MNKIEMIVSEFDLNKQKRTHWEKQWSDVSSYFLPNYSGSWSLGDSPEAWDAGTVKGDKIYSSVPIIALSRFVGIIDGLLTPLDKTWHSLTPKDPSIKDSKAVTDWFFEVNRILFDYRYNPASNFSDQNAMRWEQMGAFGTGVLFIDYNVENVLRYKCLNVRDLTLGENHQGVVNRVDRLFQMTVPNIIAQFGKDVKLSKEMRRVIGTEKESTELFKILHTVKPSDDQDDDKFLSYYIDYKNKVLMKEGTYNTFPFSIARYSVSPDEVFGRSPAMQVMADVKRLNIKEKNRMVAVDRELEPPILVKDDGLLAGTILDMTPNSVIVGGLDYSGVPNIKAFSDNTRIDITSDEIQKLENVINDVFLISLFEIMVDTPRMTATEALIRAQEKSMLLTPIVAKLQNSALSPLIERELDILMTNGLLPEPPPEVQGLLNIGYESPLNKMQESDTLVGLLKVVNSLLPLAQIDPDFFNMIDNDKTLKLALESAGVPTTILKDKETLQAEKEERKNLEQQQIESEQLANAARAIKDIGSVA